MTISEALVILDGCNWLKVSARHVSASKWLTRSQMAFLTREQLSGENGMYEAHVQTRRAKGESFEGLLIRAATLVQVGHKPKVRVPVRTSTERCACGSESSDLTWVAQLNQRVCRRCEYAWRTAAKNNDIRATNGDVQ